MQTYDLLKFAAIRSYGSSFLLITQYEMPFINKSEATKKPKDRKTNGKCTNGTNRRSRVWSVFFIYHHARIWPDYPYKSCTTVFSIVFQTTTAKRTLLYGPRPFSASLFRSQTIFGLGDALSLVACYSTSEPPVLKMAKLEVEETRS